MQSTVQKERITAEELVYGLMFSILLFMKGIGLEEAGTLFRLCLLVSGVLFVLKIALGRYHWKELVIMGIFLLWGGGIFLHIGSFSILIYAMMLFGMKNISVKKIMKLGAVVWSGCMLFTISAAVFLERFGVRLVHEKLGLGPILRESLGYTHPNVLHISFILLMTFVLYLTKKENLWKVSLILMGINAYIFFYSLSYTGVLISGIMIVFFFYFKCRKKITVLEKAGIQMILPLCLTLSFLVPAFVPMESLLFTIVNKLLNSRLWAIKVFLDEYGFTALGEPITRSNFSLDNSFVYAVGWYGVLLFAILMIAYLFVIKKYLKEDRREELAVILSFFMAGLTEQFLFNASIKNISILFLGELFYLWMEGKGREVSILEKWNRNFEIKTEKMISLKESGKSYLTLKAFIGCAVMTAAIAGILQLADVTMPFHQEYKQVYVNERLCDCDGELVPLQKIEQQQDILIIGWQSEDFQFYRFDEENSNLIWLMELRNRVSLSLYISLISVMIVLTILPKKEKRNE